MQRKPTRLEVVIVIVALMVLAFCSREPKSGNADWRYDPAQNEPSPERTVPPQNVDTLSMPDASEDSTPESPSASVQESAAPAPASDTTPVSDPPLKVKRIAMVDARNASHLGYANVLYGEVTVRWVWNGHKLVPRKVAEVKEEDGTISIWSFDNQDNVIITELPPEHIAAN